MAAAAQESLSGLTPLAILSEELKAHEQEIKQMKEKFAGREDDEVVLYRFLRGYKFNVEAAAQALERRLTFVKEKEIHSFKHQAYQSTQMKFPHAERVVALIPHNIDHDKDKLGNPISIERTALCDPETLVANLSLPDFELYHLWHVEHKYAKLNELCRLNDRIYGTTKIMDLDGLSSKHMHRGGINYLRHILKISQDFYPEMLHRLIIINAPRIFPLIYGLIKPLLNERTLSKLIILGSNYKEEISKYIDDQVLPEFLGGQCNCPGGCVATKTSASFETENISRGSKFTRSLDIPHAGAVAAWTFSVADKDIGFSAVFTPTSSTSSIEVAAYTRFNSGLKHSGDYIAPEAGTLVLTFDNSFSFWNSKTIYYQADVNAQVNNGDADLVAVSDAAMEKSLD